eukprot:1160358-Pelagomonas_calceolata.AAC.11
MTKRGEEVVASDSGWAHWETFKGHWRGVCSLIVSTGFLHLCDRESWFAPQHMNCLSQVFNQHDALPGMLTIAQACFLSYLQAFEPDCFLSSLSFATSRLPLKKGTTTCISEVFSSPQHRLQWHLHGGQEKKIGKKPTLTRERMNERENEQEVAVGKQTLVEVKYCEDARPPTRLVAATTTEEKKILHMSGPAVCIKDRFPD